MRTQMQKLNSILSATLKLVTVALLVIVSLFVIEAKKTVADLGQAAKDSSKAVAQLQITVADANQRLYQHGGLVDIATKTMLHVDRVAGEAAITTAHERQYWDTTSKKIISLLSATEKTIKGIDETQTRIGGRTEQDLADLDTAIKQIAPLLSQATVTLESVNRIATDPSIPAALSNIAATSANTASATEQLAKTAAVVEKKAEQLTKPASMLKSLGVALLDTAFKLASFFK